MVNWQVEWSARVIEVQRQMFTWQVGLDDQCRAASFAFILLSILNFSTARSSQMASLANEGSNFRSRHLWFSFSHPSHPIKLKWALRPSFTWKKTIKNMAWVINQPPTLGYTLTNFSFLFCLKIVFVLISSQHSDAWKVREKTESAL